MKYPTLAAAALLFAACSLCPAGEVTDTWNFTTEFSNNAGNPNGTWAYGWLSTDFTQFTLMTPHDGTDGARGWSGNLAPDFTPGIHIYSGTNSLGVPANWVALHPGPGGQGAVARWTCPVGVSSAASISGEFLPGDGGTMQVAVRVNGVEAFHASDSGVFALCRPVEPGTVVDFVVYGAYAYGTTPLRAVISTRRCQADVGAAGGTPSDCGDGQLDNNDFIVFINYFFTQNTLADRGEAGGVPGHDGQFDNNDFIVFINQFFDGC